MNLSIMLSLLLKIFTPQGGAIYLGEVAKNRTTFIITHRMPMVTIADRLFHLKHGMLVEEHR